MHRTMPALLLRAREARGPDALKAPAEYPDTLRRVDPQTYLKRA